MQPGRHNEAGGGRNRERCESKSAWFVMLLPSEQCNQMLILRCLQVEAEVRLYHDLVIISGAHPWAQWMVQFTEQRGQSSSASARRCVDVKPATQR